MGRQAVYQRKERKLPEKETGISNLESIGGKCLPGGSSLPGEEKQSNRGRIESTIGRNQ